MRKRQFFSNVGIGHLIIFIGILVAMPLLVLPFYRDEARYWYAFAIPSAASVALGIPVSFIRQKAKGSQWLVSLQKGSLTVLLAWLYGFIAGAVPFLLGGQLSPMHALFEAVSGWTTTGFTVMDVSQVPHIFLFHRSLMQFCGGLGFVLVMLVFLHGRESMILYNMEGHVDKIAPNIKATVQTVFALYGGFTLLGALAYRLLGMSLFDAINHSMCALSTAGFSTQTTSIGTYNNAAIEAVTIVLMLIGATSFATLYIAVRGKWKQFSRLSELRFVLVLLLASISLVTISLISIGLGGMESFRQSVFHIISALTTTGYDTADFNAWPHFCIALLIALMLIGGGLGSTSGGIKLTRVFILLRVALHNLQAKMQPTRQVETLHYVKAQGKTTIDAALVFETTGFFLTYLLVFFIGTLALTLTANVSPTEAAFEFASAMGTVGLSNGIASDGNTLTHIVLMFGMVLGRLEIFIVLIGFSSGWRLAKQGVARLFAGGL